ncbi:biotin--[acetyl-CoA-carboxylase] ligase [Epidermidibacterium keratini]|uniref:biotin--[biotin carboxyl-carrier protein] ligase n=1 Tax=Epidermidibacterium keratini TaxID=1891644 RepID=A0A7L4YQJ0_9ACTN|nr:biotin--[acetyl-CoA-carboxylase] ligase [Epidermidibacterium keratini]QHC01515.1 biotin--[acetyl-CoA-carboxylase] ligase [Epidermidibacterium keratini]
MTLDAQVVRRSLAPMWREVQAVDQTGSTNDDLLAEARAGAESGLVRVAELQTAGRGRLDRTWEAPAGTALTFSMLLRPPVPTATWGWLPLLVGLGVHDALVAGGVDAVLKWPNDVQIGPDRRKAAGILAQAAGDAVVVGVGLNVVPHDGLPETGAAIGEQWAASREDVLIGVLNAIAQRYTDWLDQYGDADRSGALAAYRLACVTAGQQVRVTLPGESDALLGVALDLDDQGRLVVRRDDGEQVIVGAGDVVHVRPA